MPRRRLPRGRAIEADFAAAADYAGKITSVREDGSYDSLYEDGDAEACVAPESVRRRSEEPEAARPETGEPGFQCRRRGRREVPRARRPTPRASEKVHEDATFDIRYRRWEREARVAEALISKRSRGRRRRRGEL